MDPRNFMTWRGLCLVCGKVLRHGTGIFCGNFLRSRGRFRPCLAAWCGDCYMEHPQDPFPVQRSLVDEEEEEDLVTEDRTGERFRHGRNGDHIMGIPFECDLCHFRNVNLRNPVWESSRDAWTLLVIRRANLDAMWSRETSTVSNNLSRLKLDYRDGMAVFSMVDPLPVLGSSELRDRVGMKCALFTLNASLRNGKYTSNLQWHSARKTQTWYENAFGAGEEAAEVSVFASDEKKLYASHSPLASKWFPRFMLGAKRRMGVIRKQDEALTVQQLLGMLELAEQDWQESNCQEERKEIEEVAAFTVISFCVALRGEETPMTSVDGLAEYWGETKRCITPYIMITLRGKFKGEHNLRWHCVPLADVSKSRIPSRCWISRLLRRRMILEGCKVGFLFARRNGAKASLGDYDPLFRDYLSRLRTKNPSLFSQGIDIRDYSLRRSPRRGAVTTAANNKVDETTTELIGRWRKKEKAKGAEPGLPMRQVYTQVSSAVEALLRFSQSH